MFARALLSIASGESPIHTELTLFLVQLVIVVVTSKLLALLLRYVKQPAVIAEVLTGVILGPSVFGYIPNYLDTIFPTHSLPIFNVFANFGLIIFMFLVGLELDTGLLKKNLRKALVISIASIVVPFALGLASSYLIYIRLIDPAVSFASFLLFIGVAMSITAFPVLARILTEAKMVQTDIGAMALSAAALNDVVAWCVLALVVSIARAGNALGALYTFLMLIGFILIMFLGFRTLLNRFAEKRQTFNVVRMPIMIVLLIMIFFCAWITEIIGVHAIFGSFILGIIIPRTYGFAEQLIERIEDLVVIILLPLYFTYSGLRTNIGSINDGETVGLLLLTIVVACVGKVVGTVVSSKIMKNGWRDSFTLGILLNTKGLVELIILNVGLDVGVLNTKVFTMFVIMALVTTFVTQPLLYLVYLRPMKKMKRVLSSTNLNRFTILLTSVNNKEALVNLVDLFCHFFGASQNLFVRSLFVQEVSDRPSTYFFSKVASLRKEIVEQNPEKEEFMIPMPKSSVGKFTYTSKYTTSIFPESDLVEYVDKRHYDAMIFMTHHKGFENILPVKQEKANFLRQSLFSIENVVARVFNWDVPELKVVRHAIENARPSIAVVVDKLGIVQEKNLLEVQKILWVLNRDSLALHISKFLQFYHSEITITILANSPPTSLTSNSRYQIIQDEIPMKKGLEIANEYDLVFLGADRGTMGDFSSPYITSCKVPVVLFYPPKDNTEYVDLP